MKILITGCAGFIGMHVAKALLARGDEVIGIDNLNDYYDPTLKIARIENICSNPNFKFVKADITDSFAIKDLFVMERPKRVIHLAAQPGVRYSLKNPNAYIQSNLVGFVNIIEACRHHNIEHLVYASSSSVYGSNTRLPFSTRDNTDHPVSLYGATKKANELIAHSYSHLFQIPTTGLRYFTVYGPWGRPDMSPWLFTKAIVEGYTIDVFNNGEMKRDFTFVEDIAEGTLLVLDKIPIRNPMFSTDRPEPSSSHAPYKIYNIGNHQPIELMTFIKTIEDILGRVAKKNFVDIQPGDVVSTFASVDDLEVDFGFKPKTDLKVGLYKWIEWYKAHNHQHS
jgi:UDP-glucuronate 4-epimerase